MKRFIFAFLMLGCITGAHAVKKIKEAKEDKRPKLIIPGSPKLPNEKELKAIIAKFEWEKDPKKAITLQDICESWNISFGDEDKDERKFRKAYPLFVSIIKVVCNARKSDLTKALKEVLGTVGKKAYGDRADFCQAVSREKSKTAELLKPALPVICPNDPEESATVTKILIKKAKL